MPPRAYSTVRARLASHVSGRSARKTPDPLAAFDQREDAAEVPGRAPARMRSSRQLTLRRREHVPELVDDLPAAGDQPGHRLARVTGDVHGVQRLVRQRHRPREHRVDEFRAGREVPVQRHPPDPGGGGDLGHVRVRVLRQALGGRGQDGRDIAPCVGPPRRGAALRRFGCCGHANSRPFLCSSIGADLSLSRVRDAAGCVRHAASPLSRIAIYEFDVILGSNNMYSRYTSYLGR